MSPWKKQGGGEGSGLWISIQVGGGWVNAPDLILQARPHWPLSQGHVDGIVLSWFSVAHSTLLQQSPGMTRSTSPRAGKERRTCCSCSPSSPGLCQHGPTQPASQRQPHYCPSMVLLGPISRKGQARFAKGLFPHSPPPLQSKSVSPLHSKSWERSFISAL